MSAGGVMRTRRLVLAAAASTAALCWAGPAMSRRRPRLIGWLRPLRAQNVDPYADHFAPAMKDLGYAAGRDFIVEQRSAEGHYDRLPALARELVAQNVDLLMPVASNATRAAQAATRSIPIVFVSINDPVGQGIVTSLSRPGGNTTGIANFTGDLVTKHIELLKPLLPRFERLAALVTRRIHPARRSSGKRGPRRRANRCGSWSSRRARSRSSKPPSPTQRANGPMPSRSRATPSSTSRRR